MGRYIAEAVLIYSGLHCHYVINPRLFLVTADLDEPLVRTSSAVSRLGKAQ